MVEKRRSGCVFRLKSWRRWRANIVKWKMKPTSFAARRRRRRNSNQRWRRIAIKSVCYYYFIISFTLSQFSTTKRLSWSNRFYLQCQDRILYSSLSFIPTVRVKIYILKVKLSLCLFFCRYGFANSAQFQKNTLNWRTKWKYFRIRTPTIWKALLTWRR